MYTELTIIISIIIIIIISGVGTTPCYYLFCICNVKMQ